MISKEVISDINVEDFLAVGDVQLDRTEDLTRITPRERSSLRRELCGYANMVEDLRFRHDKMYPGPDYSHRVFVGATRLGMAFSEWFHYQQTAGRESDRLSETYLWIQNLNSKHFASVMRSYLQQESVEGEAYVRLLGEDDAPAPAEVRATAREFQAFFAFGDQFEARLRDGGVEETEVLEFGRGVQLGAITIREAIDNHNFRNYLKAA